eukprot:3392643-Amphidinium_carterae.1
MVTFGSNRDITFADPWTLCWSNLAVRILHEEVWVNSRLQSLGASIIYGGPKSHALNTLLDEADNLGSETTISLELLDSEIDLAPALA